MFKIQYKETIKIEYLYTEYINSFSNNIKIVLALGFYASCHFLSFIPYKDEYVILICCKNNKYSITKIEEKYALNKFYLINSVRYII